MACLDFDIHFPAEKSELAKHGLLEGFVKRSILSKLISKIQIDIETRDRIIQEFMSRNSLSSQEELEQHFLEHGISASDVGFVLLKDELINQYIHAEIGERRIKARFLVDHQKLTFVDFDVLSFQEESIARYAFVRCIEDGETLKDIESLIPGKSKFFSYRSKSLSSVSSPLRNLIRSTETGKVRPPFKFNDAWRLLVVNSIQVPTLDEKTMLDVGKLLLEEEVTSIYQSYAQKHMRIQPAITP